MQKDSTISGNGNAVGVSGFTVYSVCRFTGRTIGEASGFDSSLFPPAWNGRDRAAYHTFATAPWWINRDPRMSLSWLRNADKPGYVSYFFCQLFGPVNGSPMLKEFQYRRTVSIEDHMLDSVEQAACMAEIFQAIDSAMQADTNLAERLVAAIERVYSLFSWSEILASFPSALRRIARESRINNGRPLCEAESSIVAEFTTPDMLAFFADSAIPQTCRVLKKFATNSAMAWASAALRNKATEATKKIPYIARSYIYGKDGKPEKVVKERKPVKTGARQSITIDTDLLDELAGLFSAQSDGTETKAAVAKADTITSWVAEAKLFGFESSNEASNAKPANPAFVAPNVKSNTEAKKAKSAAPLLQPMSKSQAENLLSRLAALRALKS